MELFGVLDTMEKVMSPKQRKQRHVLGWSHNSSEDPGRAGWLRRGPVDGAQEAAGGAGSRETAVRTGVSWAGQSLDATSWAFALEAAPQNASASFVAMTASLEKVESHRDRNSQILSDVVRTETEDCYCGRWEGAVQGRSNFREKGLERQVGTQESLSQRAPPAMKEPPSWWTPPPSSPSQVCLKSIFIATSPLRLQTPKQTQTLPVSAPSKVFVKSADLRASWQTSRAEWLTLGDQEPGIFLLNKIPQGDEVESQGGRWPNSFPASEITESRLTPHPQVKVSELGQQEDDGEKSFLFPGTVVTAESSLEKHKWDG